MPTQTISTFNGLTQAAGVAYSLILTNNTLPTITRISGYCNGVANTQYFLQLFNAAAPPANASVPLYEQQVLGGDGFAFQTLGLDTSKLSNGTLIPANGLILCLSSTEGVLTLGTGSVTMNVEVELDATQDIFPLNQVSAGDTVTNVGSLAVVADPSTNRLVSFNVQNNNGATQYLQLFGKAPVAGATPVQEWTVNATKVLKQFMGGGYAVLDGDANYVIHTGIYLYVSSTAGTYTAVVNGWTIQAFYI